ncbi:MAG: hypothetical protein WC835_03815 [Candidatus Paceibacterota bacterium]
MIILVEIKEKAEETKVESAPKDAGVGAKRATTKDAQLWRGDFI